MGAMAQADVGHGVKAVSPEGKLIKGLEIPLRLHASSDPRPPLDWLRWMGKGRGICSSKSAAPVVDEALKMASITGTCLCGAVKVTVAGEPKVGIPG